MSAEVDVDDPDAVADYIATMSVELKTMASRVGLDMLSYLLAWSSRRRATDGRVSARIAG